MVVAADSSEDLAALVQKYFLDDQDITEVDLMSNLSIKTIGCADKSVPVGLVLLTNAGA